MSEMGPIMSLTAMDSDAAPAAGASIEFTPVPPPRLADPEVGNSEAIPMPRQRWLPRRATSPVRTTPKHKPVTGSPRLLAQRMLVQCAPGAELDAVLPHIDADISGLVLTAGQYKAPRLTELIRQLPDRGFGAPVVFDVAAYRRHVATTDAPFLLDGDDNLASLNDALDRQIALGVSVGTTPTGYVRAGNLDALAEAAQLASRLERDDYLFTVPIDASILDTLASRRVLASILDAVRAPVGLLLGSQFDPFDEKSADRVRATRALLATSTNMIPIRTDFAAFDWIAHGAFAAAVGTGSSKRHAVDPDQQTYAHRSEDRSPSVLYPRLLSFWKGQKIAEAHGRLPAEKCECGACGGLNIARFVSESYLPDARAHGVAVWQHMARLMLSQDDLGARATFWKNRCQSALDEHTVLATQLRRAKPFEERGGLRAWATLPA